jgi:hypothetical protein
MQAQRHTLLDLEVLLHCMRQAVDYGTNFVCSPVSGTTLPGASDFDLANQTVNGTRLKVHTPEHREGSHPNEPQRGHDQVQSLLDRHFFHERARSSIGATLTANRNFPHPSSRGRAGQIGIGSCKLWLANFRVPPTHAGLAFEI